MINYDTAYTNLKSLIKSYSNDLLKNEAETRFKFIDEFLVNCLGWSKEHINVERNYNGEYSDYEIGKPKILILEAKRSSIEFNLPSPIKNKLFYSIKQIKSLDQHAHDALTQVQKYCSDRGVKYGGITNAIQLVVFLASRSDGVAPLDGIALMVRSFDELETHFAEVFDLLSPTGMHINKLATRIDANGVKGIPEKLSSKLSKYHTYRYPSDLSSDLSTIAEVLLEDAVHTEILEKKFYEECYCQAGALSQDSLISKNLLKSRYVALFSKEEKSPTLEPINTKEQYMSKSVLAESLSKRPIILIGDVGVGKTSFLKNLILVQANEEFKNAIHLYLDLGTNSFLEKDLSTFVYSEITDQLKGKYGYEIDSNKFMHDIYKKEVENFEKGVFGFLKNDDPLEYRKEIAKMLFEKSQNKESHLRRSIDRIVSTNRKQFILILDNIDQREYHLQQQAFIIAQSIAQNWNSLVFLAVRPITFYHSKRVGSLSAYPNKIFYIMPPRPDVMLRKRLTFALNIAEGKIPLERLDKVSINLSNIALFLKALLTSLESNDDLSEFLSNITGGNVRQMIEFITKFIGSSNVDSKKIIDIMLTGGGNYIIPLHEFSKSALLGDYSHFDAESSMAMNIFDIRFPDRREHFLCSLILGFLNHDSNHRGREGFVELNTILDEMQSNKFNLDQINAALNRLANKKLIEMSQRVTFEEISDKDLSDNTPTDFRITTIGAYHLLKWSATFPYLDAMVFDTPIFDQEVSTSLIEKIGSFHISDRYKRTILFRNYLEQSWNISNISVPYFNWIDTKNSCNVTFDGISKYIEKQAN